MDEDNLVVTGGGDQAFSVPFNAEVRGTAEAQTVQVDAGAKVEFGAANSDGVKLPGQLSEYSFSQQGNKLVVTRGDGTEATINMNGAVEIGFDNGKVSGDIGPASGGGIAITINGQPVDSGFDPGSLTPSSGAPGDAGGMTDSGVSNDVFLNGDQQTVKVPFDGRVVGTSSAETVQVPSDANVEFSGNSGDRVEFDGKFTGYNVSRTGNQLKLEKDGSTTTINMNDQVDLGFSDGGVDADIGSSSSGGVDVTINGQAVGSEDFDPSKITPDPAEAAKFGDSDDGTTDTKAPTIEEGQTLTFAENQSAGADLGTVKVSDDTKLAEVSATGDGAGSIDIATDGSVTLTKAGADNDSLSDFETTPNSFTVSVEAKDSAGNAASADVTLKVTDVNDTGTLPSLPSSGGPSPVSSGSGSAENVNGNQSGTISGGAAPDRFIFAQQSTDVTIEDFSKDDQLFFQSVTEADVTVNNSTFGDDTMTLEAGQVKVTLDNLDSSFDSQVFNTSTFSSAFGSDALGFG